VFDDGARPRLRVASAFSARAPVSLLRRAAGSISFRSGPPLRRLTEALPDVACAGKPTAAFRLLTVAGRAQLPLLRESLLSLARSWSALPTVVVATDGSTRAEEMLGALAWWPGPVEAVEAEQLLEQLDREGVPEVRAFSRRNVMGIKLAALLVSARQAPTLAVDTDVLWFRDFAPQVASLARAGGDVLLRMSEDYHPSYHWEVAEALGVDLRLPPFANAGIAYLRGDLLRALDVRPALAVAANAGNFFSEQTLLAAANRVLGGGLWTPTELACFDSDAMALRVTYRDKPWAARHYVSPVRHLFWRDALALRLRVGP
jgi:hypothetical protein